MTEENKDQIDNEEFSRKEREIATLFGFDSWDPESVDAGSEERIARIIRRARNQTPNPDGEARIGRILNRILQETRSGAPD